MQNSIHSSLILLLALFHASVFADSLDKFSVVAVRQTTTSNPTDPQCLNYAQIANMSTIGANSSYRAAFISASPVGTLKNENMLTAAQLKLPALMMNAALNQKCGNLTTVAITEAANNYTKGVVAQFTGIVPGTILAGPIIAVVVGIVCAIFGATFIFSE